MEVITPAIRALTVQPGRPGAPQVVDVPEPVPGEHDLLVDGLAVGVCGTDREIAAGEYGWAPPGHDRLVLGHESLGRVCAAPAGSGFAAGDLVTSRPKPERGRALGAAYHYDGVASATRAAQPDVIIDATGVSSVVFDAICAAASYGIVCLTGVSSAGKAITLDGGALNRELVLDNNVIVGSVNANLHHYDLAATALAQADLDWLNRLVTRRVRLERAGEAFEPQPEEVKVVITLGGK